MRNRRFDPFHSDVIQGTLWVVGILAIIIFFVTIGPTACTDPASTTKTLSDQGYTNITITGYRPFMGGESDVSITGFEATSPSGARVSGVVSKGWLKGSTIRFD